MTKRLRSPGKKRRRGWMVYPCPLVPSVRRLTNSQSLQVPLTAARAHSGRPCATAHEVGNEAGLTRLFNFIVQDGRQMGQLIPGNTSPHRTLVHDERTCRHLGKNRNLPPLRIRSAVGGCAALPAAVPSAVANYIQGRDVPEQLHASRKKRTQLACMIPVTASSS